MLFATTGAARSTGRCCEERHIRYPPSVRPFALIAAGVVACGGAATEARPSTFSSATAFRPPSQTAAVSPSPWIGGLRPCPIPPPASGATWTPIADVDGDGRADAIQTTCGATAAADNCATRLCLQAPDGSFVNAVAWTSSSPQGAIGLDGRAPRDFEAFGPLEATTVLRCVAGRRFAWGDGGYLGTGDRRCTCARMAAAALPEGCVWEGQ
jgi:hypothetical protein